jgi:hypothetical protein
LDDLPSARIVVKAGFLFFSIKPQKKARPSMKKDGLQARRKNWEQVTWLPIPEKQIRFIAD